MKHKRIFGFIGPAFIVASVVLGPGSVTVMSKSGASYGYTLLWLALVAGVFMAGFTMFFMRLGLYSERTFLQVMSDKLGRWFAVLLGVGTFYIASAFQFGNNLGVATALEGLIPGVPVRAWPVIANAVALVFLFGFKNIYSVLEKLMAFFVGVMILSFFINLVKVKPDAAEVLSGFAFRIPENLNWLIPAGMVATTFSLVGAISQSYLVRSKGWGKDDYRRGVGDAAAGIAMLTLIGMVIMITSAASLHARGIVVRSAGDMSKQLEAFYGVAARLIFCAGLAAAALSSFIVNAMIGGIFLGDGLGLTKRFDSRRTRLFAAFSLLLGMCVALEVMVDKTLIVTWLVRAQAGTLIVIPLAVIGAIVALFSQDTLRDRPLSLPSKVFVILGGLLLLEGSTVTLLKLMGKLG